MTILLKVACLAMLASETALAQGSSFVCDSTVQFVDRNMVDYTVKVGAIRGAVIDAYGSPVPRACLALFNRDHSKLLQVFEASENGKFAPNGIKDGNYWLVVKDPQSAFCTASTRLKLRRLTKHSRLLVNMRPQGIDSCSFCEAK